MFYPTWLRLFIFLAFIMTSSLRAEIGSNYEECMNIVGDPQYCAAMFPSSPPPPNPNGAPTQAQLDCMSQVISQYYQQGMFNYPIDGCAIRVTVIVNAIQNQCGFTVSQIWIYNGIMSPCPGVSWQMHTSACFKDANGNIFVVDPAFGNGPIPYQNWYNLCTSNGGSASTCTIGTCVDISLKPKYYDYVQEASCLYACYGDLAAAYAACGNNVTCQNNAYSACQSCAAACPDTPATTYGSCSSVPKPGYNLPTYNPPH